ncbi:hypothetical protein Zmor_027447 [Zophobas morio]|uniref:Uncharacterized protein n=1 Tax=Zophobas morio TaxID=2755281 RepID=A0AA38M2Z7_9CUCU|nr:hypothetical protein Zmor_027447 [Zophobas morio]
MIQREPQEREILERVTRKENVGEGQPRERDSRERQSSQSLFKNPGKVYYKKAELEKKRIQGKTMKKRMPKKKKLGRDIQDNESEKDNLRKGTRET